MLTEQQAQQVEQRARTTVEAVIAGLRMNLDVAERVLSDGDVPTAAEFVVGTIRDLAPALAVLALLAP